MIIHERCTQTTRTYGYTHAPLLDPPPAVSIASTVPAATIQPCTSYSQNNHDVDICGIYFTTPSEKSNSRTFPFTSILGPLGFVSCDQRRRCCCSCSCSCRTRRLPLVPLFRNPTCGFLPSALCHGRPPRSATGRAGPGAAAVHARLRRCISVARHNTY